MNNIAWRLLRQTVDALRELDRYAMELDGAARSANPLPTLPEGLAHKVWEAMYDSELAMAASHEE